jgi:hypothetical protein
MNGGSFESQVSAVNKWIAEHPLETYMSDFLKKFPEQDERHMFEGISICPCRVYHGTGPDGRWCGSHHCEDCWNSPLGSLKGHKKP